VYAYLQDDITRRRPSVDLALRLLCPARDLMPAYFESLSSEAPLIRCGLLRLLPEPNQTDPPVLDHYLRLEDQVLYFLQGHKSLVAALKPFSELSEPNDPDDSSFAANPRPGLHALVQRAQNQCCPLKLCFLGPKGTGKLETAKALAAKAGMPLLTVNLLGIASGEREFDETLQQISLAAGLHGAMLYLEGFDALARDEQDSRRRQLATFLKNGAGIIIMAGESEDQDLTDILIELLPVVFKPPNFAKRRLCWEEGLRKSGLEFEASVLDALAGRFRLTQGKINEAIQVATNSALWREAVSVPDTASQLDSVSPNVSELFASARVLTSSKLSALATKIDPVFSWNELVLPPDQLSQLHEICNRAAHAHIVYGEWGFGFGLTGKGINVLFSGPPGVGKTMAAEVIANELQLVLYKIDLSQVVSKYIGETEKNLHRIFQEARASSAILFFDEADALFGKRSEVKDAHDRYANIEVGYLLQKMEEYDGIAILATNLRHHMDEAFMRRMQFIVEIPFPDEEHRGRIWETVFPSQAPLDSKVDCRWLAREIKLAGGNIKNIALAAAFSAANNGGVIEMSHIVQATRREFQKLGRSWDVSTAAEQPRAAASSYSLKQRT
jgi:AAA+ superfamily predicted ATPase